MFSRAAGYTWGIGNRGDSRAYLPKALVTREKSRLREFSAIAIKRGLFARVHGE